MIDLALFYLDGLKKSQNLFRILRDFEELYRKIESVRDALRQEDAECLPNNTPQATSSVGTHQRSVYHRLLMDWLERAKYLSGSKQQRASIRSYASSAD